MPVESPAAVCTVALLGNPNTGKSTLFNALSGSRQRVGNYPGVTVEKKTGRMEVAGREFLLIDLPGTYSLAPRSPDEMVTVDVMLGREADTQRPDVVLCIVDASNLERNLYVVSQVLEFGLPVVIALNMLDVAQEKGLQLDIERLRKQLHAPVIPIQANRGKGIDELRQALATAAQGAVSSITTPLPKVFQTETAAIVEMTSGNHEQLPQFLAARLLLDTSGYLANLKLPGVTPNVLEQVDTARQRLKEAGATVPGIEAVARYQWAAKVLAGVVTRPTERTEQFSDRIDRWLTHWFSGTLIFVFVMLLMFQGVAWVAEPASGLVELVAGAAKSLVQWLTPDGPLRSLLERGIIDGVGGVLVFLPQIAALFLFIAVLEDCGYMSRAAYLMDKLMVGVGLSGKSFIPLLSSFACAIPGIMASRVIENRRDRFVTLLIAPLMSCSARLPVYQLMTASFLPDVRYCFGLVHLRGLVIVAMYFLGIVIAMAVAWILKKTFFRGETPPFVMELPTYKWPGLGTVFHRVWEQAWMFVRRAGTLILSVSVVVWALAYYPHQASDIVKQFQSREAELKAQLDQLPALHATEEPTPERLEVQQQLDAVEKQIAGSYLRQSYLGQMGHLLEPAVRPLGWDWRLGCAAVASFPAREVVVATLGVIYNLGEGEDETSPVLQETLQQATWDGTERKVFNIPVALSIMVFFALCAQCASTLVIIEKETGYWGWAAFTFAYMTGLAYVGAFITYRVGMWLLV